MTKSISRKRSGGPDYEQQFRALFEQTNDAVFLIDLEGRFLAANVRGAAMLGYRPEEMIGLESAQRVAEGERDEARHYFGQLVAGQQQRVYERSFLTRDGRQFPGEINASLVRDPDGNPLYVQSIVRDISERRAGEERRRLLVEGVSSVTGEDLFRTLVRHLAAALGVRHAFIAELVFADAPRARTIAFWSDGGFVRNLEYDLAGTPCEAVTGGQTCLYNCGVQGRFPDDRDLADLDADGYLGVPLRETSRGAVIGHLVAIDDRPLAENLEDDWLLRVFVSRASAELERRRIEEQLLQARKLESVSLLAGGIAHDFNNVLMGLLGYVSLAKAAAGDPERVSRQLREAERAGERATRLCQQLLTLSKGGAPVRSPVSLADLLRESAGLALSGKNVRVEFDVAEDLQAADADAGQISQVVENLTLNAVHAMPGGGVLRIEAKNADLGSQGELGLAAGPYVRIRFKDEGVGIDADNLSRIFDPYFTTKHDGTGLGLTTSYSIVRKHQGHIDVMSAPGKGSTFTIHLPAHAEAPAVEPRAVEDQPRGDRGRVLVMDDEDMVRNVVREMLSHAGYSVDLVENGAQAVARYGEAREDGAPYDAVLLDLTVRGGMGGLETMNRLLELDPEVLGIVCSGYSDDPVMADYRRYGFRGRIAKPFVARALTSTIGAVLAVKQSQRTRAGSARRASSARSASSAKKGSV